MSVYRSDDGRWRFRITGVWADGTTERVSGTAPKNDNTKAAAQRAEAQQLALMASRSAPKGGAQEDTQNTTLTPQPSLIAAPPQVPTIAEFNPTFLAIAAGEKESTNEDREKRMRLYILPRLGDVRLDEVDVTKMQDLQTALKNQITRRGTKMSATLNNVVLKLLRQVLLMAKERKLILEVPKIKLLKSGDPKTNFLSFEESDRLISAADGDWHTMIVVALRTGVRRGELMALRRESVNPFSQKLDVTSNYYRGRFTLPKNNKARAIPLTPQAQAVLKAYRPERTGLLFCSRAGVPYSKSMMDAALRRICKRAGITRKVTWHVLRHTFASHLVMHGKSLSAVQELMGHSSILQTQRYAHLAPDILIDAVNLLDGPPPATASAVEKQAA